MSLGVGSTIGLAMADSPIAQVLQAIDELDVDASVSLFTDDGRMAATDGRVAKGISEIRGLLGDFLGELRDTEHRVTSQWHVDEEVWIAEVEATYELHNQVRIGPLPRAFVLRDSSRGIVDLRVYGSHEGSLAAMAAEPPGIRVSGHWLPAI